MPLSEDEQRILQQIEQQFYESDPNLAGELGRHTLYAHHLRQMKWAGVGLVAGMVGIVAALWFEKSFAVAFVGFVVMLAAALWFERNLRKLGRAGMQRVAESMKADGLKDYFGSTGQKMRERFRRPEED